MYCKSTAKTMQYSSLWLHFIHLYVILCSVFSQPFGHSGGWYVVFSRCKRRECRYRGPAGMYLGVSFSCAHCFPFQSKKGHPLFPAIQTEHGSVLACKVRICFSCSQGFRVVSRKRDSLLLLQE